MPTESSRVNHNSGPQSLGQSSQPGSRIPAHPSLPYGQINRVPPHQQTIPHPQHGQNRPMSSNPYSGIPPRQMPINPSPGAPIQPQQNRGPPPQYFPNGYMNNEYNPAMAGQPPYMNAPPFMYSPFYPMQPPSGPPHSAPTPPNHAPMNGNRSQRNFQPLPPQQMPRPPAPSNHIPIPRRAKKVLNIVDPKTNQAIKVEKATTATTPAAKPSSNNIKIEPRASRPLSLESDPADAKPSSPPKKEPVKPADSVNETPSTEKAEKVVVEEKKTESDSSLSKNEEEANEPSSNTKEPSPKTTVEADDAKDSSVSSKPSQRISSAETVISRDDTPETATEAEKPSLKEVPEDQSKANESETYDQMEKPDSTSKPDDNLDGMTSDVSSSTFADVRSDSTDGPLSHLSTKPSEDQQSSTSKPSTENIESKSSTQDSTNTQESSTDTTEDSTTKKIEEVSDIVSSEATEDVNNDPVAEESNVVTATKDDDNDLTNKEDEDEKNSTESSNSETEKSNAHDEDEEADMNDEDDQFGPAMVFKPNERRVYPPAWMVSMRIYANTKKSTEWLPSLGNQLLKNAGTMKRTSSRDSHVSRSGSNPLSTDPRGRPFPSHTFPMPPIRGAPVSNNSGVSDAFELHKARYMPPPVLKPQQQGRDDPRGTRTQGSGRGSRHGGPVRSSQPLLDPFVDQPVEKLKRSEKAWKRDKDSEDENTKKVMEVRSLLNKLTLEKFDKIFQQIVAIDISSSETLIGIVHEIFEKPLYEPKFSSMYAELCRRLDQTIQPILDKKTTEGNLNFKRILLNNCKDEFIRFANSSSNKENEESKDGKSETSGDEDTKKKELTPLEKEEEELKALKAKRRMLANVRFIGELYLKDLLRENIIHRNCVQKLLNLASSNYEEDVLEAVCKLLSKTGAKLSSNAGAIEHINKYFALLQNMSKNSRVPARIRFMIQDLIDQRNNGWKVRREEVGAKTIAEIHKDIAEKEKAKQDAANALRDRKQRSQSARMHSDRGSGSQPRIAMTMASVNKGQSSGMSRTNMILERANRSSVNSSTQLQSMRLGPGGKSALGGSGGPSLRPGSMSGSGSRFSLLGNDTQDRSSGNSLNNSTGSSDRRTKLAPSYKPGVPRRTMSARASLPDLSSAQAPPEPAVELMDPAVLKKKARMILEEYIEIELYDEFTGCMEEEVRKHNYPMFTELLIKITMEGKRDAIRKIQNLFVKLINDGKLPASLFMNGFQKYGPELMNIEMDFPLATELYSGALAAVATTTEFKRLPESGEFGLGFIKKIFDKSIEKNAATKLVLMVCNATMVLERKEKDEATAKQYARKAYDSLDIDVVAEMQAWDPDFGPKMLGTMLSRNNATFLIPTFDYDVELRRTLERNSSEESVSKTLESAKLDLAVEEIGAEVVRASIRVGLDIVFSEESNVESKLGSVLKESICQALLKKFKVEDDGSSNIPQRHQLEAIRATEVCFGLNKSKIPAMIGKEQSSVAVFMVLYDSELVEENVFRLWKEEAGSSLKGSVRQTLLADTSKFFKWLDVAKEE